MNAERQYYTSTTGMCSVCAKLSPAKIYFESGRAYIQKYCREHGITTALLFSDAAAYRGLNSFLAAGKKPLARNKKVSAGCPQDCGLCPSHSQHTCLPIVEINNACDLNCPICIADNSGGKSLATEEFSGIIENLIACEGRLDVINISGGEPLVHPEIKKIVDLATRDEIATVTVSTNGLELLRDPSLLDFLVEREVFIALQFDGFDDSAYVKMRGVPLLEKKTALLEKLKASGAKASLVMTAALGVNEAQIPSVVKYFLENDFIRSLMVQPLSVHRGGGEYAGFDPMDRLTIPDAIKLIAAGSGGVLLESDILPLPCSHPACFHLAYLFDLGEGQYSPINRLLAVGDYLSVIRDRAFFGLDEESMEVINKLIFDLWSSAGSVPVTQKILSSAKKLMREISRNYTPKKAMTLGGEKIKSIFIHHFMDRYNFDLSRANKCCQQYPLSDGTLRPCCTFNNFSRERL